MADSTPVATATQPRVPAPPTRSRSVSPTTAKTPQDREAASRLAQELVERLWQRLPITNIEETGHRSMEQVIRAASASHRLLITWREDLTRLPQVLSTVMLRFSGDPPSEALREKLTRAFREELKLPADSQPASLSFVDAEFADLIPEIAVQHAKSTLKKQCLAFVNTLVGWLDQLQKKRLVGGVTYLDASCRFTHIERQLEIAADDARLTTRERPGATTTDTHRAYVVDHFREQHVTVRSIHRTLVHEVHQPELRQVEQCQSAIPETYRRLIEALPEWLTPSVRILEGDLFNHRCIAQDLSSDQHTLSELVRTEERTEWLYDPGILLGDFVLAAWGEAEIAAEEEARDVERHQMELKTAKQRAPWFLAAAGLGAAASGVMTWFSPPLAVLLGVAGVFLVSRGLQAKHASDPHRALRETAVIGAAGFAMLAALGAVLYASAAALGIALGLAIAAYLAHAFPLEKSP